MEDLLGDGIFNVDGAQWHQQRKLSSLEFSTKILRDFSSVVFREKAIKLSKILLESYRTNQSAEMQVCSFFHVEIYFLFSAIVLNHSLSYGNR
jgi:hypothetical protein